MAKRREHRRSGKSRGMSGARGRLRLRASCDEHMYVDRYAVLFGYLTRLTTAQKVTPAKATHLTASG